jgi:uncharacterized protein (UPF0305 family)
MNYFNEIGKFLILVGVLILLLGFLFTFLGKIPKVPYLGKLPGDILIKKKNFVFYFPITTCIILSIILTLLLRIFLRK